jgi:hypothetical protein
MGSEAEPAYQDACVLVLEESRRLGSVFEGRRHPNRSFPLLKSLGWLVNLALFMFLANRCGKSIEKRNWEQSVEYFLLALGTILYLVKITPPF